MNSDNWVSDRLVSQAAAARLMRIMNAPHVGYTPHLLAQTAQ